MTAKMAVSTIFIGLTALILSACSSGESDPAKWPERQVDIIIYSSAGGSTDLTNRVIAEGMKASIGADVVASNMPGALGGVAVNYVWNQPHDGHRLVGISEGALGHAPLGLIDRTAKDWDWFMVGGTPGVISVKADSPYKDFASLVAAVKARPDKISIATSVPGSIWHIQWLNAKKLGGFDTRFIPFPGSQPSQVAALSGEVDIVWTGLGEQAELIKGGKLRPLAVFSTEPVVIDGKSIAAITDFLPEVSSAMPLEQFVGFALPSDVPPTVKTKITVAFEQAMKSDAVKEYADTKFMKLSGLTGDNAKQLALEQEKKFAWALKDAGLAKTDPTKLGIAKP